MNFDSGKQLVDTGHCPHHGDYPIFKLVHTDRVFDHCPQCLEALRKKNEGEQYKEFRRNQKLENLWRTGIPKRFQSATWENFTRPTPKIEEVYEKARKWTLDFIYNHERRQSLIFIGPPGVGKTHLACVMLRSLALNLFRVRYASQHDIMCAVRREKIWDIRATEIADYDLLAVDEVGLGYNPEHDALLLYQTINARYEKKRPSILVSNLTFKEFCAYAGERTLDRLREHSGDFLIFDWPSFRK
jgi:DNA replication protein DnaC